MLAGLQRGRHGALDSRAVGDAPGAEVVDLHARAGRGGTGTGDHQVALRQRVGLAVGAAQRGGDQHAAAQAARVAQRRDGDVDRLAGLGKRRQRGRDHHRSDVARLQCNPRWQVHAHLLQHRLQALRGERRLRGLVTAAVEPDDQPVADQRVAAHAVHAGDVLDAHGLHRRPGRGGQREAGQRQAHERRPAGRRMAARGDDRGQVGHVRSAAR